MTVQRPRAVLGSLASHDMAVRRQLIRDLIQQADAEGDTFLKYLLEMALLHLEQKAGPSRPAP